MTARTPRSGQQRHRCFERRRCDYDRLTREGSYTIHRVSALLTLGY